MLKGFAAGGAALATVVLGAGVAASNTLPVQSHASCVPQTIDYFGGAPGGTPGQFEVQVLGGGPGLASGVVQDATAPKDSCPALNQ